MAVGTLSTQFELLSGLADNNIKAITASDVSNIVKSNFQPVMIWSGVFVRSIGTYNRWFPRTNYYNPDFFEPRSTGTGIEAATQIWRFTNTGSLADNTTYLNVQVNPDAWYGQQSTFEQLYPTQPAVFNLYTDGFGNVSSYDVVTCGLGWFGPAGQFNNNTTNEWDYPGQTGTLQVPNFSGSNLPTVEFISPLSPNEIFGGTIYASSPSWILSTNSNSPTAAIPGQGGSSDHTFLNTTVQATNSRFKSSGTGSCGWMMGQFYDTQPLPGLYKNQLQSHGIESNGNVGSQGVTLWRMPF